jgi:osmoprotectant transport system ATP-binding protein
MIETRGLTKLYNGVPAVRQVDLRVSPGELCVLLGPSGCGKSTLIRMLNALITPTAGDVFINGVNIRDTAPETLRRNIGYVVQSVGLFPHYTVSRNISVVMKLQRRPTAEIVERTAFLLDLIGLPQQYAGKYPHELSGGESQRVGVARALAADPDILLMDEPFGSVDPLNREHLQRSFADIQRTLKKTVLFVTHDVSEALALADRIVLMQEGRIVREGTPREMVFGKGDEFSKAFFGSEMALKLLARYRVDQAYVPGVLSAESGCSLSGNAPLSEALSLMLVHGCVDILVKDGDKPAGSLSFESLLAYFRGGAPDAC